MPPRKKVPTLSDLALRSIQHYLMKILNEILQDSSFLSSYYPRFCNQLKEYLYNTAACLQERIAIVCLKALEEFYENAPKAARHKARHITRQFSRLLVVPALKKLHRKLPEPIACSLYSALDQLTGLKKLSCHVFAEMNYSLAQFEKRILKSCMSLKHLTSFCASKCSDKIVISLVENCPELRNLKVYSADVTDACLNMIATCQKLESVVVASAQITANGLFELMTQTQSRHLKAVELGTLRGQVLELMNSSEDWKLRTFPMEDLVFRNVENEQLSQELRLACKFFPSLRTVHIVSTFIPDLSDLIGLEQLKHLYLDIENLNSSYRQLCSYLSVRGPSLSSLWIFMDVEETFPFPAGLMREICLQCRNLENLVLDSHYEDQDSVIFPPMPCMKFQKLKIFVCSGLPNNFVRKILHSAPNIEVLQLNDSDKNVIEMLEDILQFHPSNQIKILNIPRPAPEDQMCNLIANFKQLRGFLFYSNSLDPLSFDFDEKLKKIEEKIEIFIKINNYDVTENLQIWELKQCA